MIKPVSPSRSPVEGHGRTNAGTEADVMQVPDSPLHHGPGPVSHIALCMASYHLVSVTPPSMSCASLCSSYLNRALPPTPGSEIDMSEWPSTSGDGRAGEPTRTGRHQFDNRRSRDDSHLNLRSVRAAELPPFAPTRGQLPTPDASPRSSPAKRNASVPPARMPTADSLKEPISGGFGVASGSPAHPPPTWSTWKPKSTRRPTQANGPVISSLASGTRNMDALDTSASRRQHGKWRLFGKFAKKPSEPAVGAVTVSEPNGLKNTSKTSLASGRPVPERSHTMAVEHMLRHKPGILRSHTMPHAEKAAHESKPSVGSIPIVLDTTAASSSQPLLNIHIPDSTMERYSVMFNGVLQPQPSLLARRQATVRKLQTINDVAPEEKEIKRLGLPRRATSPQPVANSPSFVLFPPTPSSRGRSNLGPPMLSPRMRSNTSPAHLPSPTKGTFDDRPSLHHPSSQRGRSAGPSQSKPPLTRPVQKRRPTLVTIGKNSGEQTAPRGLLSSSDRSGSIYGSPTDMSSPEPEVVIKGSLRPSPAHMQPSPRWQMVSPSQVTLSSVSSSVASSSDRKRSPSQASSVHTHITQPSSDLEEPVVPEAGSSGGGRKMTPVELSIARQISVSQQQRKMLQPLRTTGTTTQQQQQQSSSSASPMGSAKSWGRGTSPSARTASPMTAAGLAMGRNERLAEINSSTPTLVHPEETLDSQLAAQRRRSEFIVLEGA
ncbi:hypothetical protein GGR56DRAFT_188377 [Xylariaceae sp. FL0804]|nr:hypothetical protein GGR56DRAFT_188377 [Xylariaceae sp. FL0804]